MLNCRLLYYSVIVLMSAVEFYVVCSEQDRGLESLSRVVNRQKQIAVDIGNEVESQNGSSLCSCDVAQCICSVV